MSNAGYGQLQDVIMDEDFPGLDLALRRGRHIDRDDAAWYTLCLDAQAHLEAFYRRFGCELIHKVDGYFYLLPTGDKLSRRQLGPGDMLVGQALALLYLDPAAIERGGVVTQEALVAQLSAVLGSDALIAAFNPKRKRFDERVAHKNVRSKVAEATRRLAGLGFVELLDAEQLRLRASLMRFAEPVRGLAEPAEALAKLAASGELVLAPEGLEEDDGFEEDDGEEKSGVIAGAGHEVAAADGGGAPQGRAHAVSSPVVGGEQGPREPEVDAALLPVDDASADAEGAPAADGREADSARQSAAHDHVADGGDERAVGQPTARDDDAHATVAVQERSVHAADEAGDLAADGGGAASDDDDDAGHPSVVADGGGALFPPDDYEDDEGVG
jgi:chromosome partition protein MukE